MPTKKSVDKFIKSQQSIQFYTKMQEALRQVLLAMPDEDYKRVTDNLIIMCLHIGAEGQCMHFPPTKKNIKIVQLNYNRKMPIKLMRQLVAHEFGHAMQGRNWRKSDGQNLEVDADKWVKKWGFKSSTELRK